MYQIPERPQTIIHSTPIVRNVNFVDHRPMLKVIAGLLGGVILLMAANSTPAPASGIKQASVLPWEPITDTEVEEAAPFFDGYKLKIQDENHFLLKDGERVIHVFDRAEHPNCEVFKVVDRDNW